MNEKSDVSEPDVGSSTTTCEQSDAPALPGRLRIDAATMCQLRCPTCPTAEGRTLPALGRNVLRPDDFERLLNSTKGVLKRVELSNYGEPFLNPRLLDIFRIARDRGVLLSIGNGSNLNHARDEVLEGLVRYGVRHLRCSIDGTTQEVYATYRRRGSLDAVMRNIDRINALKVEHRSPFPILTWQFVVFGHNQHQLAEAERAARARGMRFEPKLSWDDAFSPVSDPAVSERIGHSSREEYGADTDDIYLGHLCHQLWDNPQINADGRMLGCCVNYWQEFGGNAFDDFTAAFHSDRMRRARSMLQGEAPPGEGVPCSTCDIYAQRQRMQRWIRRPAARAIRSRNSV